MEVSAVAVVDGATLVIGPPAIDVRIGCEVAPFLELLPAEPVEHQQHHLVGTDRDRREARWVASSAGSSSAGTTLEMQPPV